MLSNAARNNLQIKLMESTDSARKLLETCRNQGEDEDLSLSSFDGSFGEKKPGELAENGEKSQLVGKESLPSPSKLNLIIEKRFSYDEVSASESLGCNSPTADPFHGDVMAESTKHPVEKLGFELVLKSSKSGDSECIQDDKQGDSDIDSNNGSGGGSCERSAVSSCAEKSRASTISDIYDSPRNADLDGHLHQDNNLDQRSTGSIIRSLKSRLSKSTSSDKSNRQISVEELERKKQMLQEEIYKYNLSHKSHRRVSLEELQRKNLMLQEENSMLQRDMSEFDKKLHCLERTLGIIHSVEKSDAEDSLDVSVMDRDDHEEEGVEDHSIGSHEDEREGAPVDDENKNSQNVTVLGSRCNDENVNTSASQSLQGDHISYVSASSFSNAGGKENESNHQSSNLSATANLDDETRDEAPEASNMRTRGPKPPRPQFRKGNRSNCDISTSSRLSTRSIKSISSAKSNVSTKSVLSERTNTSAQSNKSMSSKASDKSERSNSSTVSKARMRDEIKRLQTNNAKMLRAIKSLAKATMLQTRKHHHYKEKFDHSRSSLVESHKKMSELMEAQEKAKKDFYEARARFLEEQDKREILADEVHFLSKKLHGLQGDIKLEEERKITLAKELDVDMHARDVGKHVRFASPMCTTFNEKRVLYPAIQGCQDSPPHMLHDSMDCLASPVRGKVHDTEDILTTPAKLSLELEIVDLKGTIEDRDHRISLLEDKLSLMKDYLRVGNWGAEDSFQAEKYFDEADDEEEEEEEEESFF